MGGDLIDAGVEQMLTKVIQKELDQRQWHERLQGQGTQLAVRLARECVLEMQRLKVHCEFYREEEK